MELKKQLIENLKGFKAVYEEMQKEKSNIDADLNYTPEGKAARISNLMERYSPTVKMYHDVASEIISSGTAALNTTWSKQITKGLLDGGYQAGLRNVLEMFENDLVKRTEDAAAIIETYRGDFMALEMIKKAISQGKEGTTKTYMTLIPKDNREYNIRLLNQLSNNVDQYISMNAFDQGLGGTSMAMDSMMEFCENRLKDDLSLTE